MKLKGTRAPCAVAWILLAATASGCGLFNSADPDEVRSVAEQYTSTDDDNPLVVPVSSSEARCRAEVVLESGLSKSALKEFKRSGLLTAPEDDDQEVLREIADKIAEDCIGD